MPQHSPVHARRVNLICGEDFHCVMLAGLGFSSRLIQIRSGLSSGQIGYRLRIGSNKRQD
jgi:hypothetical protein